MTPEQLFKQVELRRSKTLAHMDFAMYVAKINIMHLKKEITAEEAMDAISALIGRLSKIMVELNGEG